MNFALARERETEVFLLGSCYVAIAHPSLSVSQDYGCTQLRPACSGSPGTPPAPPDDLQPPEQRHYLSAPLVGPVLILKDMPFGFTDVLYSFSVGFNLLFFCSSLKAFIGFVTFWFFISRFIPYKHLKLWFYFKRYFSYSWCIMFSLSFGAEYFVFFL